MIWTDRRPHSGRRTSSLARSLRTQLLKASCIGLLVFHAVLLIQRIGDSSIFTAAVLAKWLGAAALMGALLAFQRMAPMRLRGARPMVVFWLLVVLLHAGSPVAANAQDFQGELAAVAELALLVPAVIAAAVGARRTDLTTLGASTSGVLLPVPVHDFRIRRFVSSRAPPLG